MDDKSTFIKIDKFEAVTSALGLIKKKLLDAQITLDKINSLKQEEDAAIQKWSSDLNALQTKVQNIETELNTEE